MPVPRMRMRPWLEQKIDSNAFPGLLWVNKEEQTFQIPWKHAARHGWEMEKDACLFREWAIHTGRYKAGEKAPDPKTWKANFRCAMNSLPDIQEIKDKSVNKGCSAVRIYKMLPTHVKIERKERRSKPKDSKPRISKMEYDDDSLEHRLSSTQCSSLEGISCYTDHSYSGPDMEAHSSTSLPSVLTESDVSSPAGQEHGLEISLADSTNDMYPFQVSPSSSCSAETEEEEDLLYAESSIRMTEPSTWHMGNADVRGYLSNEAGNHFADISARDLTTEFEKMAGEIEFRLSADLTPFDLVSLMEPIYTSSYIQEITSF